MDASRLLLLTALFVTFGTHAQPDESVSFEGVQKSGPVKPWKQVRGLGRVLNLGKPPVVIDEPGLYVIQQNWSFSRTVTDLHRELIQITADDVTLDLRGFSIDADIGPPGSTLLVVSGHIATIRNGGLSACCDAVAVAVRSTGRATTLERLDIFSFESMALEGTNATIRDSELSMRNSVVLSGNRATFVNNTVVCNRGSRCVSVAGNTSQVVANKVSLFQGGGIGIRGNGNLVANNVVDVTNGVDALEAFEVAGDFNLVRGNTVLVGSLEVTRSLWAVSGTGNTLDGNIGASTVAERLARTGMSFTANGNFYGNNRMAAQTPFVLGGTVQTDWGGNVGY